MSPEEIAAMYRDNVAPFLAGATGRCVKAVTCLYTQTPDSGFVIGPHPESERIIIASPCSGHGFKHSAAIGEALAELAIDGRGALRPFGLFAAPVLAGDLEPPRRRHVFTARCRCT